ncbi:MAG: DEAD/DEAH box helicase family protein, partial [Candidatus Neomarinimicrobiota bacterium]
MKFELRDYQSKAVGAVKWALVKKDNCLLVAPCAAGKTLCFCEIVDWLHSSGRRCLILLDRETLVVQTAKRIAEYI